MRRPSSIFISAALALCALAQAGEARAATLAKQPNNLGLAAWLTFDEGTSTVLHDFSGGGMTGTLTNFSFAPTATTGWAVGKRGKSLSFDAADDYVNFASCALGQRVNGASVVSSSRWVYFNSWPTSGQGSIVDFVTIGQGGAGHVLGIGNAGLISFQGRSETSDTLQANNSNSTVSTGAWHHLVLVEDYPNDQFKLYIDGVLDKTASATFAQNSFTLAPCTSIDRIGSSPNNDRFFDGRVDDYRLYTRELTAAEVASMYRAGQSSFRQVSQNGLLGWWKFDEGTSTIVHDFSGNGANATLANGSPAWRTGKRGGAFSFNNSNFVANLADDTSSNITLSLWFNPTLLPSEIPSSFADLIDKSGDTWNIFFRQGVNLEWKLVFNDSTSVPRPSIPEQYILKNQWNHLVATYDGNTMSMYLNGVLRSTAVPGKPLLDTSNDVYFGSNNGGGVSYFPGALDDIRMYGRALSAAEAAALYNEGQVTVGKSTQDRLSSGLVGYWSFNGKDTPWSGSTAGVARDLSGLGNNGTLTGMTRGGSPVAGKAGQALTFDGATSYVNVPHAASLAPTSAVSFGGWIKTTDNTLSEKAVSKTESGGYSLFMNGGALSGCATLTICAIVGVDVAGSNVFYGAGVSRSNIVNGKWHHVMGTYDGETVRLYLDGALVGSNTSPSGPVNYTVSNPLCIGSEPDASSCGVTQFWSGDLDEMRVYSRALDASEVMQLYMLGK